ncbi:Mannosyltransferase [Dirofilaria immitis]|nr:Mannosyltransferase [Dirofilaria immitis]
MAIDINSNDDLTLKIIDDVIRIYATYIYIMGNSHGVHNHHFAAVNSGDNEIRRFSILSSPTKLQQNHSSAPKTFTNEKSSVISTVNVTTTSTISGENNIEITKYESLDNSNKSQQYHDLPGPSTRQRTKFLSRNNAITIEENEKRLKFISTHGSLTMRSFETGQVSDVEVTMKPLKDRSRSMSPLKQLKTYSFCSMASEESVLSETQQKLIRRSWQTITTKLEFNEHCFGFFVYRRVRHVDELETEIAPAVFRYGQRHYKLAEEHFNEETVRLFCTQVVCTVADLLESDMDPICSEAWIDMMRYIGCKLLDGFNYEVKKDRMAASSSIQNLNKPKDDFQLPKLDASEQLEEFTDGFEQLEEFTDAFEQLEDEEGTRQGFCHIRIQQRTGRKTITTVQGIAPEYDLKKIVRYLKKEFCSENRMPIQNIMLSKFTMLYALIALRILNVFLVRTYFVPDELFQSVEVAHWAIYGIGYLSWEWMASLRSVFHPFIIALLYFLGHMCAIDSNLFIIQTPRILHALLFALSDYCYYKFARRILPSNAAKYALLSYLSCWFVWYCAPRTLSNTLETILTLFGLQWYPLSKADLKQVYWPYMSIGLLTILIRPTAILIWIPFGLWHLWRSDSSMKLLLYTCLSCFPVLLFVTVLDSIAYGKLTFTAWNFIRFNVLEGGSNHFGSHPWHWFISQGLPAVLTIHLIPIFWGMIIAVRNRSIPFVFFYVPALYITVHSLIAHKEHRFLLPIIPLLCLFAALDCPPNFTHLMEYLDQADQFHDDPKLWIDTNLDLVRKAHYLVFYEKTYRKEYNCNGTTVDHPEYGEVIQLTGDQRQHIKDFLCRVGIVKEENCKIHAAPTAMIQDCGGLMIALKAFIPNIPKLEIDSEHQKP